MTALHSPQHGRQLCILNRRVRRLQPRLETRIDHRSIQPDVTGNEDTREPERGAGTAKAALDRGGAPGGDLGAAGGVVADHA
ncbi:hypothetical protein D3C84_1020150 [compost metagenome]